MKADAQTTSEVSNTVHQFSDAFTKRDMVSLMAMIAPDPDVTFFGTGADEERVGLSQIEEQLHRDWAQSESASFALDRLSVSSAGQVAWVAGDITFKARTTGKDMTFPGRLTAVMDKRDGRWLIDQWHFSIPMSGQEQGHSFPT